MATGWAAAADNGNRTVLVSLGSAAVSPPFAGGDSGGFGRRPSNEGLRQQASGEIHDSWRRCVCARISVIRWARLGNVSMMNPAGNRHAGGAVRLRATMVGCDGDHEFVVGVLIVLVDWGCVRRGGMVVEGGARKKWCGRG
ncbi:hypothetical protein Droror1_Dr00027047 [Drosera rotundifolia]